MDLIGVSTTGASVDTAASAGCNRNQSPTPIPTSSRSRIPAIITFQPENVGYFQMSRILLALLLAFVLAIVAVGFTNYREKLSMLSERKVMDAHGNVHILP